MPVNPKPIVAHCLAGVCVLTLFATCHTEKPKTHTPTFYDAILDQIVYDRYYHCLRAFVEDKDLMKIDSAYRKRAISEATFSRLVDALKKERRNMIQKCTVTFHSELGLYYKGHAIPAEEKEELLQALLPDAEFQQTFFSANQTFDPLFTPCGLHAADFNIDFLQIDPPPPKWNVTYGSISLSKPLFNANETRAVLYCEYHYDGPYGEGVFVFVEKQNDGWKVYKYLLTWQS